MNQDYEGTDSVYGTSSLMSGTSLVTGRLLDKIMFYVIPKLNCHCPNLRAHSLIKESDVQIMLLEESMGTVWNVLILISIV